MVKELSPLAKLCFGPALGVLVHGSSLSQYVTPSVEERHYFRKELTPQWSPSEPGATALELSVCPGGGRRRGPCGQPIAPSWPSSAAPASLPRWSP